MRPTSTDLNFREIVPTLIKQAFIWGPIAAGIFHQILMAFFGISRIYVFVDPPGFIEPQISLQAEWWFVLLLGSGLVAILAYSERLKTMPRRLAIPFYLYIMFLLIIVKPVGS